MSAHQTLLQQIEFIHPLRLVLVSDQDLRGHQPPVARKIILATEANTAKLFWRRFVRNWGCACVTEKGFLNPMSGKDPNRGRKFKGSERHVWRSKRREAVYPAAPAPRLPVSAHKWACRARCP